MSEEQATLGGQVLDARPASEAYDDDRMCAYVSDDGDPCDYYAAVAVPMNDRGLVPACRYHARESWLVAAGVGGEDE